MEGTVNNLQVLMSAQNPGQCRPVFSASMIYSVSRTTRRAMSACGGTAVSVASP